MVPGTRQISLLAKGVFFSSQVLPLFPHMMRTLRTSTVVLAALLAAIIEFCLFCLVCGLDCCSVCLFWLWKLCTKINIHNRKKNCCCCSRPSLVTCVLPLLVISYLSVVTHD